MRFIFDLDQTVIDSNHRRVCNLDGTIDLTHWRENSTPELVFKDSLLPLATQWKRAKAKGAEIVVCTAREMGDADLALLEFHGLEWDAMLSRPEGDRTPDDILKRKLLRGYAVELGVAWQRFVKFSVMWDDCEKVIRRLTEDGLVVHNSNYINKVLAS